MQRFGAILKGALKAPKNIPAGDLAGMLHCNDRLFWDDVFAAAREVKRMCGREQTLLRGLVECSNICSKNCRYCGIAKSNRALPRYRMDVGEVKECIERIRKAGINAAAFQGGEIENEGNTSYYEEILRSCGGLEVTLSLGEQEEDVYRRWKDAGALRYLLRIETSNRHLYSSLHPRECSFERRVQCIRTLKRLGYITGTGVMIALPGQTLDDLARDIIFFGEMEADMVGMGPWIKHPAASLDGEAPPNERAFELSLRMIALTRLYLHNVNIVSSTALGTLGGAQGIELGISAGANVMMPNFTPEKYRSAYDLYPGKSKTQVK
ncbi:MAG: [Kiritimatiellae bacterium]|nr:[FeFe] hydrogenase H-cluster radical SAM maturase HydE [Kiritimatiellia bacterium]